MSVVAAELIAYSSGAWTANPDDTATVSTTAYANIVSAVTTPTTGGVFGGVVDLTTRVIMTQITGTDTVQVLSSGADVRTVTVVGRLATGVLAAEVITLNGVTAVTSSNTYERIESCTLSAASATLTVTLRRTTGAVTIVTIGGAAPADPTEIRATALFRNATIPSSAGTNTRCEKFFWKNSNASAFALTSAVVSQASDTGSLCTFALSVAVGNDTGALATRITALADNAGILAAGAAGIFNTSAKNVPGGNMAAGSTGMMGVWVKQALPFGTSPNKFVYTSQLDGNTT